MTTEWILQFLAGFALGFIVVMLAVNSVRD
jgi:hypothetical protein